MTVKSEQFVYILMRTTKSSRLIIAATPSTYYRNLSKWNSQVIRYIAQ